MSGFLQNFFDNPILTRELRRRMRGKALIFSIIGYIIVMTITSILILISGMNPFDQFGETDNNTKLLENMVKTGTLLFNAITVIQALLVLIIAPTITAGMTTMEKERQTFDFLRVTTITPWMYIVGSFLSTIFYVSLALLCALPLLSLSFLYGGVSNGEVIERTITLLGLSMVLSALGLYISSIRERTRTAQGIVVFLIFFMIFGGIILESSLSTKFGSGLLTGGSATVFSFAGIAFTQTRILWGVFFFMSSIFLLMATRKLFDPFESRSVNHWQFAVIFSLIVAILLAAGQQAGSNLQAILFVSVGSLLLAFAALNFAVGRMEVGDEMWHLKRLFPLLRPFDQTIPYLIVVGAVWFWVSQMFFTNISPTAGVTTPKGVLWGSQVALAGFVFFCAFARLATVLTAGRKQAGRFTLSAILFFWLIVPLVGLILLGILQNAQTTEGIFVTFLTIINTASPFYLVMQSMGRPEQIVALAENPAIYATSFYLILSVICLLIAEPKRIKRWKGFSWHYDMPSG